MTASVGVAHNKFLAKLASDLDKPDGFVVVPAEGARELLAGLPIGRLWGVGKVSEQKLNRFGIRTVKDLLAVPRDLLVQQFGDHMDHLLELAVGHDERPVVPGHEAKSIGNEITFGADIADAGHLQDILDGLADKVARRLRGQGFVARTITLKAPLRRFHHPHPFGQPGPGHRFLGADPGHRPGSAAGRSWAAGAGPCAWWG